MRLSYDDLYSLWVALESPMYSSSDAIAELEREIEDGDDERYLGNKRKELREEKASYKKVMRLRKKLMNEMQKRRTS